MGERTAQPDPAIVQWSIARLLSRQEALRRRELKGNLPTVEEIEKELGETTR